MGERVATVQLEEIGLIRMVSERGVKYWSETDTICIQAKSSTRHGVLRADRMKCKSDTWSAPKTQQGTVLRVNHKQQEQCEHKNTRTLCNFCASAPQNGHESDGGEGKKAKDKAEEEIKVETLVGEMSMLLPKSEE